jgi:hypothetical protein
MQHKQGRQKGTTCPALFTELLQGVAYIDGIIADVTYATCCSGFDCGTAHLLSQQHVLPVKQGQLQATAAHSQLLSTRAGRMLGS